MLQTVSILTILLGVLFLLITLWIAFKKKKNNLWFTCFTTGGDESENEEEVEDEYLNLLYDPCLNCYFDPETGKYYELAWLQKSLQNSKLINQRTLTAGEWQKSFVIDQQWITYPAGKELFILPHFVFVLLTDDDTNGLVSM